MVFHLSTSITVERISILVCCENVVNKLNNPESRMINRDRITYSRFFFFLFWCIGTKEGEVKNNVSISK